MFDLTTIITLLAPAVLAPLGYLAFNRVIRRAETARQAAAAPAPSPQIVFEPTVSPVAVEPVAERNVA